MAMQAQLTTPQRSPKSMLHELYHEQNMVNNLHYDVEPINTPASRGPRPPIWRCRLTCPAVQFNGRHIPMSTFTASSSTKDAARNAAAAKAWYAIQESNVPVTASAPPMGAPRDVGHTLPIGMNPHLFPRTMLMLDGFLALRGKDGQLQHKVDLHWKYSIGSPDPEWRCWLRLPAVQLIEGSFPVSLRTATLITSASTREAAIDAAAAAALRMVDQPFRSLSLQEE
jgi:hypothetical protein